MIGSLFRGVGRIALLGASFAFVVSVVLLLTGSYMLTWPLHRLSPRNQRMHMAMDLAASVAALVQSYAASMTPPESDT